MAKVSIIIPVYNVEPYLRECLDSVVNQTLKDIEIICIDDCSTDGCLAILNDYAKKDNRFVIVRQRANQGQGVARNCGLDIANGEYIMFLDSDDWLELDACESAYNQIDKNKNDFCIFGYNTFIQETGELKPNKSKLEPFKELSNFNNINLREFKAYFYQNSFTVTQIYSKNFLNKFHIRYSKYRNGEDILFMTQAILNSGSVSVCFRNLYNYRKLLNSSSRTINKMWAETTFFTREEAYKLYLKNGNENLLKAFVKYYIKSLLYWYKQIPDECPKINKYFYNNMRKIFKMLQKKYDIKDFASDIDYFMFRRIIKYNYEQKILIVLLRRVFSITNSQKHKIINLFGIKIKLKKKCL